MSKPWAATGVALVTAGALALVHALVPDGTGEARAVQHTGAGPHSGHDGRSGHGGGGDPAVDPRGPNLDPGESVRVSVVPDLVTSTAQHDPSRVTHREFQANCTPNHRGNDDPVVFPGRPGAAHEHTFMGATTTDAFSTTGSLAASPTSCSVPDDHSAYWFPTLFAGNTPIVSDEPQTVYYKSGITDHRAVRPFPRGLRFVAGDVDASEDDFRDAAGSVEGYECGDVTHRYDFDDFPAICPSGMQLNIRYQAPSCWDGVHLDSADHRSHLTHPVLDGQARVCPSSHPVAVPMLEFKTHFPLDAVGGDLSRLRLSSGGGPSWHYDFFNSWEPRTLAAMVTHCITGGLQCDTRGADQHHPERGRVLDDEHELLMDPAG